MNEIVVQNVDNCDNGRVDYCYYMNCTPELRNKIDKSKSTLVVNGVLAIGYSFFNSTAIFWDTILNSGFKSIEIIDFTYDVNDNKPSNIADVEKIEKNYNYLMLIEEDEVIEGIGLERGLLNTLVKGAYSDRFKDSDMCFVTKRDYVMNKLFNNGYIVTEFSRGITKELAKEEKRVLGHIIDVNCCFKAIARRLV